MKQRSILLWSIAVLLLASLACAQAGEILPPEEATARAQQPEATPEDEREATESELAADFAVGDEVTLITSGAIVPLQSEPGGTNAVNFAADGDTATIAEVLDFEGTIWFQVDTTAGLGWVTIDNINIPEDGEAVEADTADVEEPEVGDTALLVGRAFLVNLMNAPGSENIISGSERDVVVTILDKTEVEGTTWYLVDTPTAGEGWVPAENIALETP